MCMATMRESRDGVRFLINTQVPAAPRVWHFSAFHLNGSSSYQHRKPATQISTNSSVVSLLALSQESFRATLFHTQVICAKLEGQVFCKPSKTMVGNRLPLAVFGTIGLFQTQQSFQQVYQNDSLLLSSQTLFRRNQLNPQYSAVAFTLEKNHQLKPAVNTDTLLSTSHLCYFYS